MTTITAQPTDAAEALAAFEAQPALQAGTAGYWEVWGAKARHARPGDLLLSKHEDGTVAADYVADLFTAKSQARQGFIDGNGERFTVGHLAPVVVVRWGTHATLA